MGLVLVTCVGESGETDGGVTRHLPDMWYVVELRDEGMPPVRTQEPVCLQRLRACMPENEYCW